MGKIGLILQSQDFRYASKTALKVVLVPVITTALILYSVTIYLSMNYSFFVANGYEGSSDMREAFWDYFGHALLEVLPWVAGVYLAVFALGIFLSHLVLTPFSKIIKVCEQVLGGYEPELKVDPLNAHKLVLKSALFFMEYLNARERSSTLADLPVPEELQKIKAPRPDGVFYFQYFVLVMVITTLTGFAVHTGVAYLHEQIVESAMLVLKSKKEVGSFLLSQTESVEFMSWACTAFTALLYLVIARSIIREVEGVSYGYLRDLREILSGAYEKRLTPRKNDPGKEAAFAINQVLNLMFTKRSPEKVHTIHSHTLHEAPPAFIEEFRDSEGKSAYRVLTPNGEVVEGLDFEDTLKLIKKVS